jgi:hypothetical protein
MLTLNMQTFSISVRLYHGVIYVFSDMVVAHLASMRMALIDRFDEGARSASEVGVVLRKALAGSISWVEREEYEKLYAHVEDPQSIAIGVSGELLDEIDKESGCVGMVSRIEMNNYLFSTWWYKNGVGKGLHEDGSPLPKSCTDEELGLHVQRLLKESLEANLKINGKPGSRRRKTHEGNSDG